MTSHLLTFISSIVKGILQTARTVGSRAVRHGAGTPVHITVFTKLHISLQGGPAKVRPTYIFDGNI